MQGAAFAVAEHTREFENPPLARGEELFAGEFRRSMKVKLLAPSIGCLELGREGVEMGLIAGRDLQDCGLHFDEALRLEVAAKRRQNRPPRSQEGLPVGMDIGRPPGRSARHGSGAGAARRRGHA